MNLLDQHESNTRCQVQTVVADHKYGTSENYVACQARGITTHMSDALGKARHVRNEPSLTMKLLLMIRCATSIVVLSVKA